MIAGVFHRATGAVIPLTLVGSDGARIQIEAYIDTGFDGYVALPVRMIASLGPPSLGSSEVMLGDGRTVLLETFTATVILGTVEKPADVLASDGGPLVGLALLDEHHIGIDVTDGGMVTIRPIC